MAQTQTRRAAAPNRVGLGVGMALLAVGATALYFFTGERGARNRRKVRDWMLTAKGEILERMEDVKDLNQETYERIVDSVLKRYRTLRDVSATELAEFGRELKGHWRNIERKVVRTNDGTSRRKRSGRTKKAE
jgi:hypothetical protein